MRWPRRAARHRRGKPFDLVIGDFLQAYAAPPTLTKPMLFWELARDAGVPVTLLVTRRSDLAATWALPNTIGYDLAREGVKLHVGRTHEREDV